MLTLSATVLEASEPYWWWRNWWSLYAWRSSDDYAVANVGQLKNFAKHASLEMNSILWSYGGAGNGIQSMLEGWDQPDPERDDYAALTAGEAKAVAKKFYDRLAEVYAWPADSQPWSAIPTATTDDHAVINIGQLKNLFSFEILNPDHDADFDGMSNGFEIQYGLDFRVANGQVDQDEDGISNLMESWLELNPVINDSNGDGVVDGAEDSDLDGASNVAELTEGTDPADSLNGAYAWLQNVNDGANEQLVLRGALAEVPFKLRITTGVWNQTTQDYDAMVNLPVVFEVLEGPGTLENETGTQMSSGKLIAFTDANGYVTMRFRGASVQVVSKVRASLLRLRPYLDTQPEEYALWTSQCVMDTDDDGLDDQWETAILAASSGLFASITEVLPTDDFDRDGVPNIFEFDRGTDPTNPAAFPNADIILDHTGAAQGNIPVVPAWAEAVEAVAEADYGEHPETRRIIKIMPGSYDTAASGRNPSITRSVFLWGQGSVGDGLPVLTSTDTYGVIIDAYLNQPGRRSLLMVQGLVLDGGEVEEMEGLNFSGRYFSSGEPPSTLGLVNCIIRHCPGGGITADYANAWVSFSTITGCGSVDGYPGTAISLYGSRLQLANSILWNENSLQEVETGWQSLSSLQNSVIGGTVNPGITAEGRLTPGEHVLHFLAAGSMIPRVDIDGELRLGLVQIGADQIADSDGDGVPDSIELAQGSNALQTDTDGDGTPDGQDDFPLDPLLQTKGAGGAAPVIVLETPRNAQPVP